MEDLTQTVNCKLPPPPFFSQLRQNNHVINKSIHVKYSSNKFYQIHLFQPLTDNIFFSSFSFKKKKESLKYEVKMIVLPLVLIT